MITMSILQGDMVQEAMFGEAMGAEADRPQQVRLCVSKILRSFGHITCFGNGPWSL
jgi:hypothetical protein